MPLQRFSNSVIAMSTICNNDNQWLISEGTALNYVRTLIFKWQLGSDSSEMTEE